MGLTFDWRRLCDGLSELEAIAADAASRRAIRRAAIRWNLWNTHRGWSAVVRSIDRRAAVTARLAIAGAPQIRLRIYSSDLLVLRDVLVKRAYDLPTLTRLDDVQTVVDLGSNTGITALWWRALHPSARIVCVEPEPSNLVLLRENLARHPGVDIVPAAVCARDGPVTFNLYAREWSHSSIERPGLQKRGTISVDGLTLAALVERTGITRIDVLKVDIEGAESEVLPQLASLPIRPRVIVAELHPPYTTVDFERDMYAAGLRVCAGETSASNLVVAAAAPAEAATAYR